MSRDFTLAKYAQLCQAMAGWEVLTVRDFLVRDRLPERCLVLRHDVDRQPANALRMAGLEARFGIRSTYYFRMQKGTFVPRIIRAIADMGHEVGYHLSLIHI